MHTPLISTLICTYNAEAFIERTLESVLSQSYNNQEILILDNHSKDDTITILRKYTEKDSRIQIFTEGENLGAYTGLNYLLDKSKGKYIAIQDHDDLWHSEKLSQQVEFLETHTEYIGCGTGTLMYYGVSQIGFVFDTEPRDAETAIHTSLMFRNEGFRYDTTNDFLCDGFFMKHILCNHERKLKILPEILTLHYFKENGGNYSEQWFILNLTNVYRYFHVYGIKPYTLFLFIYLLLIKLLPLKIKLKLDMFLVTRLKGAQKKAILASSDPYMKEMLASYNP